MTVRWPLDTWQVADALWHALHGEFRGQQQAAYSWLADAPEAAILIASPAR